MIAYLNFYLGNLINYFDTQRLANDHHQIADHVAFALPQAKADLLGHLLRIVEFGDLVFDF